MSIRLVILPKSFSEKVLIREQEIIEQLIVKQMCNEWSAELVFTGIRSQPGLILLDCATEDTRE